MSAKKRLMIVCYPSYGGSGVIATELGKSLVKLGYEVHIVSYQTPIRLASVHPNLYFHEVKLLDYPVFNFTMYESALTSTIIDVAVAHNIHVVHAHYAIPHAYTALLAKQILAARNFPMKVVTTLHGTDITLVGSKKVYKPLVEYAINLSDEVSAVSDYLRTETYSTFDVQRPIRVIKNFVDYKKISSVNKKPHFRSQIAHSPQDKIMTHISNFREVKRAPDVVEVFYKVYKQYPNLTLLMIGDGPDRYATEEKCREFNICDRVKFLGKVDEIEYILAHTDIFFMPSQSESFGLAALEALAAGVPVISSNVGGLPELIEHGVSGYLYDVGDTNSMSQSALGLLQDSEKMYAMKKNAQERASLFDISHLVGEYEMMYKVA